jgi:hypothetical protein
MRKALKRELGRQKQAKNLQESIESGLRAQGLDQKQREEAFRQALLKRDKKPARPENEGNSKTALEKKARVQARLELMEELNLNDDRDFDPDQRLSELNAGNPSMGQDLDTARDFVKAVMVGGTLQDAVSGPVRKL